MRVPVNVNVAARPVEGGWFLEKIDALGRGHVTQTFRRPPVQELSGCEEESRQLRGHRTFPARQRGQGGKIPGLEQGRDLLPQGAAAGHGRHIREVSGKTA